MKHLARNLYEMKTLGYDKMFFKKAIYKLRKKEKWMLIGNRLLEFIRDKLFT